MKAPNQKLLTPKFARSPLSNPIGRASRSISVCPPQNRLRPAHTSCATQRRVGLPDPMPTVDPAQHPYFFDPKELLCFASFEADFDTYDKDPVGDDLVYADSSFFEKYEDLKNGK